ncbi:CapA family protein [Clostridium thermarum]|uniref:CapA family protein n=1 Tax=Clostridium thermarum TaxID=1716543 RepID=UPI00111D416A|nr:CapA family protein [Clostridium thermarum]
MGKRYRKNTTKETILNTAVFLAIAAVLFSGGFFAYEAISKYLYSSKEVIQDSKEVIKNNDDNSKETESPDREPTPQETPVEVIKETNVLISAVGDCTIGTDDNFNQATSLPTVVQKNDGSPSYLFNNVAHIFKEDDITIANLETTFTTSNVKRNKGTGRVFHFKGDPSLAESLVTASIEGVNLSNNHIYDYGTKGFTDTIDTLENYDVAYFGEGYKWVKEVKGIKFAFLGYQGWVYSQELIDKVKTDIETLKAEDAVVIVSFHWGDEGMYLHNDTQTKLAYFAIDNGADLVLGHHPHVIQGVEKYKDRYICYSLGNFCFGGNSNPKDKDTLIFQADFKFTDDKLTSLGVRVIPCSVSSVPNTNDYRPTPLAGDAKIKLLEKINKYSIDLGYTINDNFNYLDIK